MGKTIDQVIDSKSPTSLVELSERKRHGRAINAVADYLRSHLRVPNVYIDPSGAGLGKVDVLAADAAGSGDIHAVEVKMLTKPMGTMSLKLYVELVKKLPAHYKYLAIPKGITNVAYDPRLFFSADGIGRVGVLLISELGELSPTVELYVKPERFRLAPSELSGVERYLNRAKPDMFVRL